MSKFANAASARTAQARAARTAVNGAHPVEDATVKVAQAEREFTEAAHDLFAAFKQRMPKVEVSSGTKAVIIFIGKILAYSVGAVAALYAVSYMSAFLITLGVPAFLVAVAEIFGLIVGMVASWYASDKVIDFVANGGVSRTIERTGSFIKGIFAKKEVPTVVVH